MVSIPADLQEKLQSKPFIIEWLQSKDFKLRRRGLWRLLWLNLVTIDLLVEYTQDKRVRITAIQILGRTQNPEAIPYLIPFITNGNPTVRWHTLIALEKLAPYASSAIPALLKLGTWNLLTPTRRKLIEVLGKIGSAQAVPYLITCLADKTYAKTTMVALHRIGEGCIPYLMSLLQHKKWQLRSYALRVLGTFPSIDEATLEAMFVLMNDPRVPVRVSLAWAIGQLRNPLGLPTLLMLLEDDNLEVRQNALQGLAKLGEHAQPIIPKLIEILASDAEELKGFVLLTLGATQEPSVISAIQRYLNIQHRQHHLYAMLALEKLNALPVSYAPEVIKLLRFNKKHRKARKLLERMGIEALPYMLQFPAKNYSTMRAIDELIEIIEKFGEKAVLQLIEVILESPDRTLRWLLTRSVLHKYLLREHPLVSKWVVKALRDPDTEIRHLIISGLAFWDIDLTGFETELIQILGEDETIPLNYRNMLYEKIGEIIMHEELFNLLKIRSVALIEKDKPTLDHLFAPNFIYTNAQGYLMDKADYFANFIDSEMVAWQSQEISEAQAWLYGDTAIINCKVHDVATYNGEPFDAHFRTTHTLIKLEGRWQIVASHTSPLNTP